jgi:hypothetical protein
MERIIEFTPAFDKRNPEPGLNYGIHGVDLVMFVKKGNRAVQFKVFTNWHLPHVRDEYGAMEPMAADLGYHSPVPMWEGQDALTDNCLYTGGKCYYDGSTLNAEPVFEKLIAEGSDAAWDFLEQYWHETFD